MRLPMLFQVGLGLVMGSWTLDVFISSEMATSFYRAVITSFPLTAFSAAIYKQTPMLFDIAGFSSLYTWIPVLVCMGVGFIASSILCAIAELIVSSVYEFVKTLLPLLGNAIHGGISLGYELYRLPKLERKDRVRQSCQCAFITIRKNVVGPFQSTIHLFVALCITALILVLYVGRYFPSLESRLSWLEIDGWFIGSGPQATLSFDSVLRSLLNALFYWGT